MSYRQLLAAAAAVLIVAAGMVSAQEPPRLPLAEVLRGALANEPPAAVQRRFTDELAAGSLPYEVDIQDLQALMLEYIQAGEMEKSQAVLAVLTVAAQAMLGGRMPDVARAAADSERQREAARPPAVSEEERVRARALAALGPPRDDLDRFHGLYRAANAPADWLLFLVGNCDGHLVFGTTWADVAPWTLRSLGDTRFEWLGNDFGAAFRIDIATRADGRAAGIEHDSEIVPAGPLARVDDLPPEFLRRCGNDG